MTNEEAQKMLTAKIECMKREASGIDLDCNYRNCDECSLCYAQGTTGDQIEALNMAIKALITVNSPSLMVKRLWEFCTDVMAETMKQIPLTCRNCIWNEDLFCDKRGRFVHDDDKACRKWELVKGDDANAERKSDRR